MRETHDDHRAPCHCEERKRRSNPVLIEALWFAFPSLACEKSASASSQQSVDAGEGVSPHSAPLRGRPSPSGRVIALHIAGTYLPFLTVSRMRDRSSRPERSFSVQLYTPWLAAISRSLMNA